MIEIPNIPGRYQGEGLRILVQKERIVIDTSQLQLAGDEPQAVAIRKPKKPVASTQDRLATSTIKTTKFVNDFLWGE